MKLLIILILSCIFSPLSLAKDDFIKSHGEFKPVENQTFQSAKSYKVVFDVYTTNSDSTKLNRGINTVARFINMHINSGLNKKDLDIALVLHGKAGRDTLNNKAYQANFNSKNPNLDLIEKLNKFGVNIIVCGQTLGFNNYNNEDLIKDVKVSLSAMSALLTLQQSGYHLINFN